MRRCVADKNAVPPVGFVSRAQNDASTGPVCDGAEVATPAAQTPWPHSRTLVKCVHTAFRSGVRAALDFVRSHLVHAVCVCVRWPTTTILGDTLPRSALAASI